MIQLIHRLNQPWELVETGKAYWIGYTDDMYSIAHYKNQAIPALVNFIDTAKNKNARLGGLLTLHLIGINSKIAGRFVEDFSNKNARLALLRYLDDKSLHSTVVSLLMRDPWLSDLPSLMDYLSKPGRDYSKVLNALQRYEFDEKPLRQKITDTIFDRTFSIKTPINPDETDVNICALIKFQKELAPHLIVDKEITQTSKWKNYLTKDFPESPSVQMLSFEFLVFSNSAFLYSGFNSYFFDYKYSNHKVEIIGPIKARQTWLDWWSKLPKKDKGKFYSFVHLPIDERFKKN
ncbi:MAG TPA: hypothetical protein VHC47_03420, partial [Mucilaginibacter sp.]|nr:hypothetical protein [Mucilaginibacter sp.]